MRILLVGLNKRQVLAEKNLGRRRGLSKFKTEFSTLYDRIREQATRCDQAITASSAIYNLEKSPDIVLIVDGGISEYENSHVLERLRDYVEAGGTVIFAGLFARQVNAKQMKRIWEAFDLPWEFGPYHVGPMDFDEKFGFSDAQFLDEARSEAILLSKVELKDATWVLQPTADAYCRHKCIEGECWSEKPQRGEHCAAVLTEVIGGKVGYIGDTNADKAEESMDGVLRMIEL